MKSALMLLVIALLFATRAEAQQDIVVTQLDSAVVLMAGQGYTPLTDPIIGSLDEGETDAFKVAMEVGKTYMIVGVCDSDCSDLDLIVSDADGNELEADRELDDVPMLYVEPARATIGVVSVDMATCSNSCVYGVRVFEAGN